MIPGPRNSARLRAKAEAPPPPKSASSKPVQSRKKPKTAHPAQQRAVAHETTSTSKVKGRRGYLKFATEMPLDVLLEIFSYLQPFDLLNISFASTALRGILLNRGTSQAVWKSVFRNADPQPPECPSSLNLVQFTNLLYGRHCYFCGTTRGTEVFWNGWVRYCKDCRNTEFIVMPQKDDIDRVAEQLMPWHTWRKDGAIRCFVLKDQYQYVRGELERLKEDKGAYDTYVAMQSRLKIEKDHNKYCLSSFENEQRDRKFRDLKARRTDRKEAVLGKLRDLGYDKELSQLGIFAVSTLPGVTGTNPMTEKAWENLKPNLIAVMDELRAMNEEKDRRYLIGRRMTVFLPVVDYFSSHRIKEPVPKGVELATMEPFRSLIFDTPADQDVTQEEFLGLIDQLPELVAAWKSSADEVLLSLLPQSSNKPKRGKAKALDPSILGLATTLFGCKWCSEPITYPRVLVHSCLSHNHRSKNSEQNEDDADNSAAKDDKLLRDFGCAWNKGNDQVTFDEEASEVAKNIIIVCGQDPAKITLDQMDELDRRIECLRCRGKSRLVMTWRSAVLHDLEKHSEHDGHWKILGEADAVTAKDKESKQSKTGRKSGQIGCVKCSEHYSIVDGKLVSLPNQWSSLPSQWSSTPMQIANRFCRRGHDMSKFIYVPLDTSFKRLPYALRIE